MSQEEESRIDELLAQLRDPDPFRRRGAALELGRRKEVGAVEPLIALLSDDQDLSGAASDAAWALGKIGDPRAVEPLIAALYRTYGTGGAMRALGKLRDERALEPLIRRFEQSHAANLATILGNWGDRRAVPCLIAAMHDPNALNRYYAARALGKLGDARALPALECAVANDTEPIRTKSTHGKSVSDAAVVAVQRIKAAPDAN